jgi:hypothetical protein
MSNKVIEEIEEINTYGELINKKVNENKQTNKNIMKREIDK